MLWRMVPCRRAVAAVALWAVACGRGEPEGDRAPDRAPSATAPTESATVASVEPKDAAPPPPKRAESITIIAGGDVNLGRSVGKRILEDPKYDPFVEIAPVWKDADVRFVNLESQLSDQNGEVQSPHHRLVFTGPPGGADVLAAAKVDIVSLANNHMWDYGGKALFETIDNLERVGVKYAGASKEKKNRAYDPAVLKVNGWSIAFFAATHIWNQGAFHEHRGKNYVAWARFDRFSKRIKKARDEHDLVLVSYHGGSEYVDVPMEWTRDFVRAVMNAGADAFIGHHPHVPQGVGWFGDRPAFYSLGNFVFNMHRDHPWTGIGFLAKMTFKTDGSLTVEACPYHILGHVPKPFAKFAKNPEGLRRMFARHLKLTSVATGRSEVGEPGELSCVSVSPPKKRRKPWLNPASKANLRARERLKHGK